MNHAIAFPLLATGPEIGVGTFERIGNSHAAADQDDVTVTFVNGLWVLRGHHSAHSLQ